MNNQMDDLTIQLTEELDAFDPRWRDSYPNVRSAAKAAGVLELFCSWLGSDPGKRYLDACGSIPDHVGQSRREAAAMANPQSLPYGYENGHLGMALTVAQRDDT